jgi:hypothetical protein
MKQFEVIVDGDTNTKIIIPSNKMYVIENLKPRRNKKNVITSILIILLLCFGPYLTINLSKAEISLSPTTTITGSNSSDLFGWNISLAGDVNGDSYDDFLVGAPGYDNNRGRAYVFFGYHDFTGELNAISANITINGGAMGDNFGWDVASAGDLNNDGFDDIIIGAPGNNSEAGASYIFFGNDTLSSFMNTNNANITIKGETPSDRLGSSVSSAGDVNNDDYDDVIIGAPGNYSKIGAAHIIYGNEVINGSIIINAIDANVTIYGNKSSSFFGSSVSDAGDVNNDGFGDVIIGAPGVDEAYIFYGGVSMNTWKQSTKDHFDSAERKVHINTTSVFDGEAKLETFYNIKAMSAYLNGSALGQSIPKYSNWTQTSWTAEGNANNNGNHLNQMFDLESGTVRKNEKILAVSDSNKDITFQIWNGESWGSLIQISGALRDVDRKGFAVAYESQSGDAIAVYYNESVSDDKVKYRIWNGTDWSVEKVAADVGTAEINWIALASSPINDEIIMVTLDKGNREVYGQIWNGSEWWNPLLLESAASVDTFQCFDVTYEQRSGDGIVVWGDNSDNICYRKWNTSNQSWDAKSINRNTGNQINWIKLASDSNSNNIILGALLNDKAVDVEIWNGTSWGYLIQGLDNVDNSGRRGFDVTFESKSGRAMIAYDNGSKQGSPEYRIWTPGTDWSDELFISEVPGLNNKIPEWVELESDPQTNEIILLYVNDNGGDPPKDYLCSHVWNGSSWWTEGRLVEYADRDIEDHAISYTDTSGYFNSQPYDAKFTYSWGRIQWTANIPQGTILRLRTRTSPDSNIWSEWSAWYNLGDRITNPNNRWIQYQVWFETINVTLTPVLNDISIELNHPNVIISGTTGNKFGFSVSGAGLNNDDNFADLLIGAPWNASSRGSAYLFYGQNWENGTILNATSDSTSIYNGSFPGDQFGYSVAGIMDISGDGNYEVLVGAPYNGTINEGHAYLFYGNNTTKFIPSDLANSNWSGERPDDHFGYCVSDSGIILEDGIGFGLAIGAPNFNDGPISDAGKVYIFLETFTADYLKPVFGDDQICSVDQDLPLPVIFRVMNASGYFVPGAKVNFTFLKVPSGVTGYYFKESGSIFFQATSNNSGFVSVTIHLGNKVGNYIINVSGENFTGRGGSKYVNTINATAYSGLLSYIELTPKYIYPDTLKITTSGVLNVYNARGYDKFGNLNLTWSPTWGNTDPLMGTSLSTGGNPTNGYAAKYTAGALPGFDNITVQSGSILNRSCIEIVPGALSYISLTPMNRYSQNIPVMAGRTFAGYRALGYDVYGNLNISWSPIWSTTSGKGSANSIGGNAISGYLASYTAYGNLGYDNLTVKDTATGLISNKSCLKIIPDVLNYIKLTPHNDYPDCTQLKAGKTSHYFTVIGYDKFGNLNTTWSPHWNTSNGLGMIISQGGDPQNGFTAKFQAGRFVGYDNITVQDNTNPTIMNRSCIKLIHDDPGIISIVSGNDQTGVVGQVLENPLKVRILDSFNNPVGAGVRIYFNITDTGLNGDGVFIGSGLTSTSILTDSFGEGMIALQLDTKIGINKVKVEIIPGIAVMFNEMGIVDSLTNLALYPEKVNIPAGSTQNFDLEGFDQFGNPVTPEGTIWETDSGTIINQTNIGCQLVAKTKSQSGGFIKATVGDISNSSVVNIRSSTLFKILIEPNPIILNINQFQEFHAIGKDIFNNTVELLDTDWVTDCGTIITKSNTTLMFRAQLNPKENGYIKASSRNIEGFAVINIIEKSLKPIINGTIPNVHLFEDDPPYELSLESYELDVEDSDIDLKWYIENNNPRLYDISGEHSDDDIIVIIPKPNAFGDDLVNLVLIDSSEMTASQQIWINITPVNDKPIIDGSPDIIVHYDTPYKFDYNSYSYDLETSNSDLILSVNENIPGSHTTIDGLNVTYNFPKSLLNKNVFVTLNLSDGDAWAYDVITVEITEDYVPTLVNKLPDIVIFEGETRFNVFNLNDYFQDPDKDSLFYSFGETHINVYINENNSVDISSSTDWYGIDTITFRAKDPIGAIAEDTITVTVLPINDPPVISGLPTKFYVHYDADYRFDLTPYISDKDNQIEDLFLILSDNYIRFTTLEPLIIIMNYPESMVDMEIKVKIVVSDGVDTDSETISVQISDNWPPEIINKLPDVIFYEDEILLSKFKLNDYFLDKEGSPLFYSYGQKYINITINSDYNVDFSAIPDWYGSEIVTFRATDQDSAFVEMVINITVIPVNDPPIIKPLPAQYGVAKHLLKCDLSEFINDIDNNKSELVLTIDSDKLDITVSGTELVIYSDKAVVEKITITVSDGFEEVSETVMVEIKGENSKSENVDFLISIMWLLILIIIMIISIFGYALRRRYIGDYEVEELYWIENGGVLLFNVFTPNYEKSEERLGAGLVKKDSDIVSGMLTGVLDFTDEVFYERGKGKKEFCFKEIKLGEKNLLVERGKYSYLAAVFIGRSGKKLYVYIDKLMHDLEKKYGKLLSNWDGEINKLDGGETIMKKTMLNMPHKKRSTKKKK